MDVKELLEKGIIEEDRDVEKYLESLDELIEYAAKTNIPFCTISYNSEEAKVGGIHCSIHKGKTLEEAYYDMYDLGYSCNDNIYVFKKDDHSSLMSLLKNTRDLVEIDGMKGKKYKINAQEFYEQIKNEPNGFEEKEEVPLAEYCSRKPKEVCSEKPVRIPRNHCCLSGRG